MTNVLTCCPNSHICTMSFSCLVPASRSSCVLKQMYILTHLPSSPGSVLRALKNICFSKLALRTYKQGSKQQGQSAQPRKCYGAVQVLWSGPHGDVPPPGHHLPVCCGAAAHACVIQPQRTAHVAQARVSRALPGEAADAGMCKRRRYTG